MSERQVPRRRGVQFSHSTQLFFVQGIWEYTEEEKAASWLTEEDNVAIQRGTLKVVKRMRKGTVNEEKYCIRGLEHMRTSAALEERKVTKRSVIRAVLAEQRRMKQSSEGVVDPVLLCQASEEASRASREAALRLGAGDAMAVGASASPYVCSSESVRGPRQNGSTRTTPPIHSEHAVTTNDSHARAGLPKTSQDQKDDDDEKSGRSWSLAALARRGFVGKQQGGNNESNAANEIEAAEENTSRRSPAERRQSFDKLINTISLQFSPLDAEAKHTAEEITEKQRRNSKTPSE